MLLSAGVTYLLFGVILGIACIHGSSMEPNYHDGQIALFSRVTGYSYEDVVFVESDALDRVIIKRVIGLPGDEIEIVDGVTYRNGQALSEAYAIIDSTSQLPATIVPDDSVFVLGDNRPNSTDSRAVSVGCIATDHVLGKALFAVGS